MAYLLAALLGGAFLFNSKASPDRVEKMAETTLRTRFPGANVDVAVKGKSGLQTIKGKFKRFDVSMSGFDTGTNAAATTASSTVAGSGTAASGTAAVGGGLSFVVVPSAEHQGRLGQAHVQLRDFRWNTLPVESAEFTFNDVIYDRSSLQGGAMRIVSVGASQAHLLISAASLQGLLATRLKSIQDARLSLQNGLVQVRGKKDVPLLGVPIDFTLTARPEARRGNEIWLAKSQVAVMGGMAIPPAVANSLTGDLNPVYVFDAAHQWPFRVQITNIQSQGEKLELWGDLVFVPAVAAK